MSEEVIAYQFGIAFLIIAASTMVGKRGMQIAALCVAVFTVAMVFTKWLFLLQFLTIFVSMFGGSLIYTKANFLKIRATAWYLLAAAAYFGYRYLDSEINSTSNFDDYIPVADEISCRSYIPGGRPFQTVVDFIRSDAKKDLAARRKAEFKAACDKIAEEEQALEALTREIYDACVNAIKPYADSATLQIYPDTYSARGLDQRKMAVERTEGGWKIGIHASDANGGAHLACYTDKIGRVISLVPYN